MQYIAKQRIGEAQEKLIHTDLSITKIALGIGYNNVSSFNYAFAKFAGMSPSQFRSRYADRRAMRAARSTQPASVRWARAAAANPL